MLKSMGLQRVRHDLATEQQQQIRDNKKAEHSRELSIPSPK